MAMEIRLVLREKFHSEKLLLVFEKINFAGLNGVFGANNMQIAFLD